MYRNILLAYDGSPDGKEALKQVRALAAACRARVHVLTIVDRSSVLLPLEGTSSFVPDDAPETRSVVTGAAANTLRADGFAVTGHVGFGDPAEQIVHYAREIHADLIVVGHRDQGALARWLNGSVGQAVLHQAPCSLLIAIKPPSTRRGVVVSLAARRKTARARRPPPNPENRAP